MAFEITAADSAPNNLLSSNPPASDLQAVAAAAVGSVGHDLRCIPDGMSNEYMLSKASSVSTEPAVYAVDLSVVARQFLQFRQLLPTVTPYYAVKCNPDRVLLSFLSLLGASFDIASSHEMALVADVLPPDKLASRTIFANPFKALSDLRIARSYGVSLMTVDAVEEVVKIAHHYPNARVLLRIVVDDKYSACPLSSKFGARSDEIPAILTAFKRHNVRLLGVAFHVGSGCRDAGAYTLALKRARSIFDAAKNAGLPRLEILDIGGGFPGYDGEEGVSFPEIADMVRDGIDSLFDNETVVIAEPGRYFAEAAFSLAVQVVLTGGSPGARWCTVGDGVYGSFRDALLLGVKYTVDVIGGGGGEEEEWTLHGPTNEVVDVIARGVMLPRVKVGDWLRFRNMGAYTSSLTTKRASVERYQFVYFFGRDEGDGGRDTERYGTLKRIRMEASEPNILAKSS